MLREFQEEIARLKAMLESQAEGSGAFEEGGGGGGGGVQAGPVKAMSSKQLATVSKELQEQENMREEERERAAE